MYVSISGFLGTPPGLDLSSRLRAKVVEWKDSASSREPDKALVPAFTLTLEENNQTKINFGLFFKEDLRPYEILAFEEKGFISRMGLEILGEAKLDYDPETRTILLVGLQIEPFG